jgi:hypothetical protein
MATTGTPRRPGHNALVFGALPQTRQTVARNELLKRVAPDELDVLEVSYARSPDAILDDWRDRLGASPRRLVVLSLDRRSVRDSLQFEREHCKITLENANPHDLTEFGMRWQRALDAVDGPQTHPVVDFDSLTSMLQFVKPRKAFQFVHMLTGHVREIGARAQFYLAPEAHDDRTCQLFRSTVDEVRYPTAEEASYPEEREEHSLAD